MGCIIEGFLGRLPSGLVGGTGHTPVPSMSPWKSLLEAAVCLASSLLIRKHERWSCAEEAQDNGLGNVKHQQDCHLSQKLINEAVTDMLQVRYCVIHVACGMFQLLR